MVPAKAELSLTDCPRFGLANIIVLNDIELLVNMLFALVADTYEHEDIFSAFPHGVECDLGFGHVVGDTNLLWKLILHDLALGVIPDLISLELPLIIMSRLEPRNHRVLVSFFYLMLIRPLVVLGLVNAERLALEVQRVFVVAQLESVIVVSALLLDAQVAGLGKCQD